MALVDLCEPLFQYVCLLNRSARKGASPEPAQVRGEILGILSDVKRRAASDPRSAAQHKAVQPVLAFFADFIIRNSALPWAATWQDLAGEFGERDGDERFFDMLDDTLLDRSPAATEQLAVYYTCVGLGFTGWYSGQNELLKKRMMEMSARMRGATSADHAARIVPEAYEHVNTGNLIDPPVANLTGVGIALVGLLVVLFAANLYLYRSSSKSLSDAVQEIIGSQTAAPATLPATAPATRPANESTAKEAGR